MKTPKELDQLLSVCAENLVDCYSFICDSNLEPVKKNSYSIGKCLAEIGFVRSALYKSHPELKPEQWDNPIGEHNFASLLQEAIAVAAEYLAEGNSGQAIKTLTTYCDIVPSEVHVNLAKAEIERIQNEQDV
jgi:hypothetical protein